MTLTDFVENVRRFLSGSPNQSADGTPSPALVVFQNPEHRLIWHRLANPRTFDLDEVWEELEKAGIVIKGVHALGIVRLYSTKNAEGLCGVETKYWFAPTCAEHAEEILDNLVPEVCRRVPSPAAQRRKIDAYNRMTNDRRKKLDDALVAANAEIAPPPEGESSPQTDAVFFELMASGYSRDEILGACMTTVASGGRG